MNNIFLIIILFIVFLTVTKNIKKEKFSYSNDNLECNVFQDLLSIINEPNLLSNNTDLINIELEIFEPERQKEIKEMISKGMTLDQIKKHYKDCTNL